MKVDFKTVVPGKWVLAGEHAVLRMSSAVAFPLHSKSISLIYIDSNDEARADFKGDTGEDLHLLFWGVMEYAHELAKQPFSSLRGKFILHSTIPIGVGMGGSAALCVSVARWFVWKGWLTESEVYDFAKSLEDLFHGQSSGMDIAAVLSKAGIVYKCGEPSKPLTLNWAPQWYLSDTQQVGLTSHCVKRVKQFVDNEPDLGAKVDSLMDESVNMAVEALALTKEAGLPLLAKAINQAKDCFDKWHLISENMVQHMRQLKAAGAIAMKPTGSGDGGFVLSLWPSDSHIDQNIRKLMVSLQPEASK